MHSLRVAAVALLLAGVLMMELAQAFFTHWTVSVSPPAWTLSLAAFICLCSGLALAASTVIYAPLDRGVAAALRGLVQALGRCGLYAIRQDIVYTARGHGPNPPRGHVS